MVSAGVAGAWLTGLGLVALAAAVLFLGGPGGIETILRETLAPVIDRFVDESGSSREALTDLLALVTPGAIAASWMVMTASNAILAQGVLARFGTAWRPSPDLAALTLPMWLSGLLAAAAMLAIPGGAARFFGVNMLIVLSVPFCLAGLAVLHSAARRLRAAADPARRILCVGQSVRLAVAGGYRVGGARRAARVAAAFRPARVDWRKNR